MTIRLVNTADTLPRDADRTLIEWRRENQQAVNRALNIPSFSVHRNGSNQTAVVTATPTKLAWTTAEHDSHSYFDLTTNYRYTPKLQGVYAFHAQMRWTAAMAAGNPRTLEIYKNGAAVRATNFDSADSATATIAVAGLIVLNGSTDYVEVFVSQASGVNRDVIGTAVATFFHGHKVSD